MPKSKVTSYRYSQETMDYAMGLVGAKTPIDLLNKGVDLIISTYDPTGVRADEEKVKEFFRTKKEGSQTILEIIQKYNLDYHNVLVGIDEGKTLKDMIAEAKGSET